MSNNLIMAIDLGTSFIKAGLYDTETGMNVAVAKEPVHAYKPSAGVFIQKGEELLGSVVQCIKKVANSIGDRKEDIQAIAFTGQMSGFMGVDKDWNDITTWSCSLDTRYMPYLKKQLAILGDEFLKIGGTNLPQMAPKYEWFKNEFPEENAKIIKYLMISGYVIGKLGDIPIEDASIDRTYIEWTGLADVQRDRWSSKICDTIGLNQKYLPKIVTSNTICAHLNEKMAKELGLPSGIPLVSGAGDKAAGCLGAAILKPGDAIFEAASYGEISCCVPEYRPDMEKRGYDVIPAAIPGLFYVTKFIPGSGIILDWFIDTFVKETSTSTGEAFAAIEEEMKNIPAGCEGLMAIGLLNGSSMPFDESLKGTWMGATLNHTKAHFYKALMESLTYDFDLSLKRVETMYPDFEFDEVKMIGGGAKSSIWPQMCADIERKKYSVLDRDDVAMWGVVIAAGNAVGIYKDMGEIALNHVKVVKQFSPDLQKSEEYDRYVHQYRENIRRFHKFYTELD